MTTAVEQGDEPDPRQSPTAEILRGRFNVNHRVVLGRDQAARFGVRPGTEVLLRTTRAHHDRYDLRIWPEYELLTRLVGRLDRAPRPISVDPANRFVLLEFVPGSDLGSMDPDRAAAVARGSLRELITACARFRPEHLPALPVDWPTNTGGFLRRLVDFSIQASYAPVLAVSANHSALAELGVPGDADRRLRRLADRADSMRDRAFALLHTDLHGRNMIQRRGRKGDLTFVDWELALYGDPLYELTNHICRMGHRRRQRTIRLWQHALSLTQRDLTCDLHRYLEYERCKSVFSDFARAVGALGTAREADACAVLAGTLRAAERYFDTAHVASGAQVRKILDSRAASLPEPTPDGDQSAEAPVTASSA